jgi:hypothetical protein
MVTHEIFTRSSGVSLTTYPREVSRAALSRGLSDLVRPGRTRPGRDATLGEESRCNEVVRFI